MTQEAEPQRAWSHESGSEGDRYMGDTINLHEAAHEDRTENQISSRVVAL